MLIYNVTTQVAWDIQDAWVKWMKEEHIARVMSSQCFTHHRLVKLLEVDDSDGPTFAIQYFCNSPELYHQYARNHASRMRQESLDKWGDRITSFRSLMEVVD
jgi:hypothetical protein